MRTRETGTAPRAGDTGAVKGVPINLHPHNTTSASGAQPRRRRTVAQVLGPIVLTAIINGNEDLADAILALGRQDVDVSAIRPRADVDVIGASSDHLILEARDPCLEVGKEVEFDVAYGALLRAMTSPYVEKVYRPLAPAMVRQQGSRSRQRRQHVYTVPGGPS